MRRALLAFTMLSLFIEPVLAAPGVHPWNRECIRVYEQWKKKPKHKAFAVSNESGGQACGSVWSAPSRKSAEQQAIKWCRSKAEEGGHCRVTASE